MAKKTSEAVQPEKKKKILLSIYIPPELAFLKVWLEKKAKKKRTTVSNFVVSVLWFCYNISESTQIIRRPKDAIKALQRGFNKFGI